MNTVPYQIESEEKKPNEHFFVVFFLRNFIFFSISSCHSETALIFFFLCLRSISLVFYKRAAILFTLWFFIFFYFHAYISFYTVTTYTTRSTQFTRLFFYSPCIIRLVIDSPIYWKAKKIIYCTKARECMWEPDSKFALQMANGGMNTETFLRTTVRHAARQRHLLYYFRSNVHWRKGAKYCKIIISSNRKKKQQPSKCLQTVCCILFVYNVNRSRFENLGEKWIAPMSSASVHYASQPRAHAQNKRKKK